MAMNMDVLVKMFSENPEEAKEMLKKVLLENDEKAEEIRALKMEGKMTQKNTRVPLSRQRGADKIPNFSGKEFLPFQRKLIGFCQDDPGTAALLKLTARKYRNSEINANQNR